MKIKKINFLASLLLLVFMFLVSINFAFAAINTPGSLNNLSSESFSDILENIVNWIAGIAALIAALVIIIAGILWMTAGADEDAQSKARKLLISGVVGLGIALAALALVSVVTGFM